MTETSKRLRGQFYTITNPFDTVAFYKWLDAIPSEIRNGIFLEPFAGANNIPAMLEDAEIVEAKWDCFDVEPSSINRYPKSKIQERDTIANFPTGYHICITNPPYLSKNSATRRGIAYPNTGYDDMYKLCLEKMLDNVEYVAAIIPETFLTSGLFTDRLIHVISLTCKMFDDTECPVCLALFVPEKTTDFTIWQMNEVLGKYSELKKGLVVPTQNHKWRINDPYGSVGIKCIDGTEQPSIMFCRGEEIDSKKIKHSSRSITRVSGLPDDIDMDGFLDTCNSILSAYRNETKDVFLASFKGLRADGRYRRRLDFATAKSIMSKALEVMA